MPMPMAPPPGTVLETAVLDSVTTAACGYVSPGIVATMTSQYVARFHSATAASAASCGQLIDRTEVHTADRLVNCGRKYQKTTTTIARDTSGASTCRHRHRNRRRRD